MPVTPPTRPPLDHARLTSLAPGWDVTVVAASPSTHQDLAARAASGRAEPGEVLVAEHQTAGRGRLDRTWTTPDRAALTLSVLVEPDLPDTEWPWLPLLLGLAVRAAVSESGGPACDLKWPNDVLHHDLKLGGLLAERVSGPDGRPRAVLSVGLNVTTTPDELPVPTATSLREAGWQDPDRTTLLVALLAELRARLDGWRAHPDALRQEYADACVTVGQEVRVELPGRLDRAAVRGRAVGVAPDGSLVVDTGSATRRVDAGDVVHVRPA